MSFVLHGVWSLESKLLLWGETKAGSELSLTGESFAASAKEISAYLESLEVTHSGETTASLTLPIRGSSPYLSLASPEDGRFPLGNVEVPAIEMQPLDALFFLTTPFEPSNLQIRPGSSLVFWIEASKFLLDTLARGRLIASLSKKDGRRFSTWYPALNDVFEKDRFELLSRSMPLAARACRDSLGEVPEASSALCDFLESSADKLVRYFLRRSDLALYQEELSLASPRAFPLFKWAAGLTSDSGVIDVPHNEGVKLEKRIEQWSGSIKSSQRSRIKLHFTLTAPRSVATNETEEPVWPLAVSVELSERKGSRLPLEFVLDRSIPADAIGEMSTEELEEFVLGEMGKVILTSRNLAPLLLASTRSELLLSTSDAYDFLRTTVPLLEGLGCGVHIPSWWQERRSPLGLRLQINTPQSEKAGGAFGLGALANFSWQISLGEESLTDEEFRKLVSANRPLVQIRGEWFALPPDQLKRTASFIERSRASQTMSLRDLLQLGLGVAPEDSLLPITGLDATGWLKQFLEGVGDNFSLVTQPEDFHGELRPYQLQGVSWLSFLARLGIGGCLADDMGLGKTVQLLALMLHEKRETPRNLQRPTLLVVPMSILGNWQRECEKFAPSLKAILHHGTFRTLGSQFREQASEADLVITTYHTAHRDELLLGSVNWKRIALDEAQNIKNLNTKQTRAIRSLTFSQMEKNGDLHRLALTGTPLENHLEELWSIFDFLNPGLLGSLQEFRRQYSIPIERLRDQGTSRQLSALIRPFVLRRLKRDPAIIADLPEKIEVDEQMPLTPEQAALYQSVLNEMLPAVDAAKGIHRKGMVLATITKLKQICDHPSLLLKDWTPGKPCSPVSSKLHRLEELLEEILAEGDRALIFTQFVQMGEMLLSHIRDRFNVESLFLHGGLTRTAREKLLQRFREADGPPIFILSLKAGGYGLNLTEATQVIHFDQWWNPAVQDQATDRAYRIGQKRNVQVRRLITKGTLEEQIAELLTRKRAIAAEIVTDTKNLITELSTDELRQLLSLKSADLDDEVSEEN